MSHPTTSSTDFFDQLTADLHSLRGTVAQRFRPLTDQQLNRRPAPSKWSIGQCLEHLNIVGGYYLPVITRKIQLAKQRGSTPAASVKHGIIGQRLTKAMRAPVSEKSFKSPQKYAPSGSRLPRTVVEVCSRQLDELLQLVEQARSINANSIRIPNPVLPLIRLRLTDALELLVVHLQRHMAQAERVLDSNSKAQ